MNARLGRGEGRNEREERKCRGEVGRRRVKEKGRNVRRKVRGGEARKVMQG